MNLVDAALEVGFEAVGWWETGPLEEEQAVLDHWVSLGCCGPLRSLRNLKYSQVFASAQLVRARTWVVCLVRWERLADGTAPWAPATASYARGVDYHRTVGHMLARLAEACGVPDAPRFVDISPLPERALARRAGLGWIGRHRFLVHPELGGDVCIGELGLPGRIPGAAPSTSAPPCAGCSACVDACPTGALGPHGVDVRKCLAFHSSMNRGVIPWEVRGHMHLVLGCDECLKACDKSLANPPEHSAVEPFLAALLAARSRRDFEALVGESCLGSLGRPRAVRNAVVVAAARGLEGLVPQVEEALEDPSPLIRAHAAWALVKLEGRRGRDRVARARGIESHPVARAELERVLAETQPR